MPTTWFYRTTPSGSWTGLDVLNQLRSERHDIPFILVTGALGEERAVECMRNGVSDYVLKGRLERLPVAIRKALDEKRLRREREHAELSLQESEAKFRALAESLPPPPLSNREPTAAM